MNPYWIAWNWLVDRTVSSFYKCLILDELISIASGSSQKFRVQRLVLGLLSTSFCCQRRPAADYPFFFALFNEFGIIAMVFQFTPRVQARYVFLYLFIFLFLCVFFCSYFYFLSGCFRLRWLVAMVHVVSCGFRGCPCFGVFLILMVFNEMKYNVFQRIFFNALLPWWAGKVKETDRKQETADLISFGCIPLFFFGVEWRSETTT